MLTFTEEILNGKLFFVQCNHRKHKVTLRVNAMPQPDFSKMFKIFLKNVLNKEFANVCDGFVDNKLLSHFGADKTKCILFSRDKN